MNELNTADFFNTLTMAELNELENSLGLNLDEFDQADTRDTLIAMAELAAKRLGVDIPAMNQLHHLSFAQLQNLLATAAATPPKAPKELTQLLAVLEKTD